MKVLILQEHGAAYCTTEKDTLHPISDMSEDDVLAIVNLILNGVNLEMDKPPEDDGPRKPAELVIYRELYRQFSALVAKRDEKLKVIDDIFKDAEQFYEDDELKNGLIGYRTIEAK